MTLAPLAGLALIVIVLYAAALWSLYRRRHRAVTALFLSGGAIHMRLWLTIFCIGLCGSAVAAQENATVSKPEITYNKDVAPLLQKHCVACHRPNDIAPMSLTTYDEVLSFCPDNTGERGSTKDAALACRPCVRRVQQ